MMASSNLDECKRLGEAELRLLIWPCNSGGALDGRVRQLKATANGLLSKLTAGKTTHAHRSSSLLPIAEAEPGVSIPLASLLGGGERRGVGVSLPPLEILSTGAYYLRASVEDGASPIVGEIALHIVSSPGAFGPPGHPVDVAAHWQQRDSTAAAILHQQYLTFPSGSHCWRRVYALLHQRNLHLYDFQRHHQPHGAPINLNAMTDVRFLPMHPCGLENVLVMSFEGEPELMAYADDTAQGLEWADAVSRAVWNQPYVQ